MDVTQWALEKAKNYVESVLHGDFYAFPVNGKGKENHVIIVIYRRETVLQSIITEKILNACKVEVDTLKLAKLQLDRIRQAFGKPLQEIHVLEYENYKDMEKDARNGLRATTFEKVVARKIESALNIKTKWVGALKNSTFDVWLENGQHLECKGLRGAFEQATK